MIHLGFVPIDFPREVLELPSSGAKGWRRMVRNAEELESYWGGKNGSGNVYFTAYGYTQTQAPKHHRVNYNTPLIHHFVMDFDCKDFKAKGADVPFEKPHEEVKRLHNYFMGKQIEHYVWFSGGGFHLWIPLAHTLSPKTGNELSRIKYSGRLLMNQWEKDIGTLRCNDPTVAFDTSGMIRIPNSYNARRECWSVPLTSDDINNLNHQQLIEKAQEPHKGYIALGSERVKLQVIKNKIKEGSVKKIDLPTVQEDNLHILPCLAQAAMGGGNPTDRARYLFVSYLADRMRMFFPGWKIDDATKESHVPSIVRICAKQEWVDFDPEYTEMRVRNIVMAGHTHANCFTLATEGLCVGKCRYYDETGLV